MRATVYRALDCYLLGLSGTVAEFVQFPRDGLHPTRRFHIDLGDRAHCDAPAWGHPAGYTTVGTRDGVVQSFGALWVSAAWEDTLSPAQRVELNPDERAQVTVLADGRRVLRGRAEMARQRQAPANPRRPSWAFAEDDVGPPPDPGLSVVTTHTTPDAPPDRVIEAYVARLERVVRAGSADDVLRAAEEASRAGPLPWLAIYGHAGDCGRLKLQAVPGDWVRLDDRAADALAGLRDCIAPSTRPWQVGIWGCETATGRGAEVLQRLADVTGLRVAGLTERLYPSMLHPRGLDTIGNVSVRRRTRVFVPQMSLQRNGLLSPLAEAR